MKPNEEVETQKHSGISLTLQDDWVIVFRSFDIWQFGHIALIYLKLLNVASARSAMSPFVTLFIFPVT